VILREYPLDCVSHVSYLIADLESGLAAVIDPQPDVDCYLEECWRLGVDIRHVFLTQIHDDLPTGHLALRDRACAHLYMGAWAKVGFPFTPLKNGDVLEFGKVRLEILEVPGHVLEGISLLYYDLSRDSRRPEGVLTGDTVLRGDVGRPRPRLQDGLSTCDLAGMLYDSLRQRILPLPDGTRLHPGNGLSALSGLDPSEDGSLGSQRVHNFAFQPMSRREFVRRFTAGQFREERESVRRAGPGDGMIRAESLAEVLRARGSGVRLVDVRDPADFAGAHLEGSVNVPLASEFESWAGAFLGPDEPLVIISDPGGEGEAAWRLRRIGLEQVAGCLRDGMLACEGHPALVRKGTRITPPALAARLESGDRPFVVDVGDGGSRPSGTDLHVPLEDLCGRADDIPRGPLVVVRDADPFRSSAAASLLRGMGRERVADLLGGRASRRAFAP